MPTRLLLILAFLLASDAPATAHGRSVSYSSFEIDAEGADVTLRMALLELSRLGPAGLASQAAADRFAAELVLRVGDEVCVPRRPVARSSDREGFTRFRWRVDCPTGGRRLSIESRVLLGVAPSHLHFSRVRFAGSDGGVRERVLTEASPTFFVRDADDAAAGDSKTTGIAMATDASTQGGSRWSDYLRLGVHHILSGWDHLAFLLGLVLLAERLGSIARLVTGFTLAHSLTLALTVAGLVHPRPAAVEAAIAFSVALVALEKGWQIAGRPIAIPGLIVAALLGLGLTGTIGGGALPFTTVAGLALFTGCYFAALGRRDDDWLRVALTFAFGLVHGFGFAGVLVELELPRDRLVPALVGFNLGVELGQLAVVLAAWPLVVLAARLLGPATRRTVRDLALAGLAGLGVFWLVARSFGA